ncbi:hypothetical protein ALC57_15376 [Trachymyrmex cornetzi]|uniref:Uncharacterized protein n=1 Tax=Trachymyrmex cornetzi TaxID=471704 RepID=A0A195DID5_9HYME|nr:hypothetical protein ALC57_15376 [Trachymyrmex cornetzi]
MYYYASKLTAAALSGGGLIGGGGGGENGSNSGDGSGVCRCHEAQKERSSPRRTTTPQSSQPTRHHHPSRASRVYTPTLGPTTTEHVVIEHPRPNHYHRHRTKHKLGISNMRHILLAHCEISMSWIVSLLKRYAFPRRVASNQKHPACGARTGVCTMRKKHWEDRLIRAGSSHNGIPGTMDTDREKSCFSVPRRAVPRRFLRRICTEYLPRNFTLQLLFRETLLKDVYPFSFFSNFTTKYT